MVIDTSKIFNIEDYWNGVKESGETFKALGMVVWRFHKIVLNMRYEIKIWRVTVWGEIIGLGTVC